MMKGLFNRPSKLTAVTVRGRAIVKLSTLALDFDGTIAQNDVLDPEVRKAIAEARAQGVVVLLLTGRILETCVGLPAICTSLTRLFRKMARSSISPRADTREFWRSLRHQLCSPSWGAKEFFFQLDNLSSMPTRPRLRGFSRSFNDSSCLVCS